MPKKIDAALKERAMRMFADHRQALAERTAVTRGPRVTAVSSEAQRAVSTQPWKA